MDLNLCPKISKLIPDPMTIEIRQGFTEKVTLQFILKNYEDLPGWQENRRAFQARMSISAMIRRPELG